MYFPDIFEDGGRDIFDYEIKDVDINGVIGSGSQATQRSSEIIVEVAAPGVPTYVSISSRRVGLRTRTHTNPTPSSPLLQTPDPSSDGVRSDV